MMSRHIASSGLICLLCSTGLLYLNTSLEYVKAMFRNVLMSGTDSLVLFDAGVGQVSLSLEQLEQE